MLIIIDRAFHYSVRQVPGYLSILQTSKPKNSKCVARSTSASQNPVLRSLSPPLSTVVLYKQGWVFHPETQPKPWGWCTPWRVSQCWLADYWNKCICRSLLWLTLCHVVIVLHRIGQKPGREKTEDSACSGLVQTCDQAMVCTLIQEQGSAPTAWTLQKFLINSIYTKKLPFAFLISW